MAFHVWQPDELDWPMARHLAFERDGTEILLTSADVDRDELLTFATTVRPAGQRPPSLG